MQYKDSEELSYYEKILYFKERDSVRNTNELINRNTNFEGLVDFQKIYRYIVNYRIKKYGTSSIIQWRSRGKGETQYMNELARKRHKRRLGK